MALSTWINTTLRLTLGVMYTGRREAGDPSGV